MLYPPNLIRSRNVSLYDASASQIARWKEDPAVTKIVLDKILVCPCCEGVPTFRQGCGCCGSAMTAPDVLIHHYACAHIASEAQFRKGDDLVCPKCRQTNLVAGSDFEAVAGRPGLCRLRCPEQSIGTDWTLPVLSAPISRLRKPRLRC